VGAAAVAGEVPASTRAPAVIRAPRGMTDLRAWFLRTGVFLPMPTR
jgi:hypothetical protein